MKYFRYLLFPFSVLYGSVLAIRNLLYSLGVLKSTSYSTPIICVGNLSTGGTGKSPMIEFLINALKTDYKVATLSRGYKRTTKGFIVVKSRHLSHEVGDEPLQFKTNFPEITVAVDANRRRGISNLLKNEPELDLILLDDAFQHRKVKPDLTILLSTYGDIYVEDFVLPTGNLREFAVGAKRAQLIVITKCPPNLSDEEQVRLRKLIRPKPHQLLLFSTIVYSDFILRRSTKLELSTFDDFTLITGIANPLPLVKHLKSLGKTFKHLAFPDHHEFSETELKTIIRQTRILTTQKDFMRLKSYSEIDELYYIPIEIQLLDESKVFFERIKESLNRDF